MTHNAFCLRNLILLSILLLLVTDYNTNLLSAAPATGSKDGGNLIWAKTVGGTGWDECRGITTLSDNSTVVTGWFSDTVTFGDGESNATILTSAGEKDIFIAKYNKDGILAWVKRVGGTSGDCGDKITTLSDDSVVVAGGFSGSVTFGQDEPNETVLTPRGLFIARYNSDGTLEWARRSDGGIHCITTLSDNSMVMTGEFCDTSTFGPGDINQTILNYNGYFDIFVAKYNPDGSLAWVKQAGGVGYDSGHGITTLSDNSTIVTGSFTDSITFGLGEINETVLESAGDTEIFIARYNTDGTLAWAKRTGGMKYDSTNGITTLSDNSIVVTGSFRGSSTFGQGESNPIVLTSNENGDFFIARYNPDGTIVWAKSAGGTDQEWGSGITALSDDSIVVTGGFQSSATFGPGEPNETILTSAGYFDVFIARYNPDGSLVWVKRAGGASTEGGWEITMLSDDSTVVTGVFYESSTFGPGEPGETVLTSAGERDFFIARFAP